MELIDITDRLEQKLLEYNPLREIYYVDRHIHLLIMLLD